LLHHAAHVRSRPPVARARRKINIAFIAIGIDYFQVLAIFANSKVKWPPQIRELLHILSAFNLNIEIVAPECLVPDVSFMQKWSAIMAIPLAVYIINLAIYALLVLYRVIVTQGSLRKSCGDISTTSLASLLALFYLMYIYLSKNVMVRRGGARGRG
jgi:hypothetical protein